MFPLHVEAEQVFKAGTSKSIQPFVTKSPAEHPLLTSASLAKKRFDWALMHDIPRGGGLDVVPTVWAQPLARAADSSSSFQNLTQSSSGSESNRAETWVVSSRRANPTVLVARAEPATKERFWGDYCSMSFLAYREMPTSTPSYQAGYRVVVVLLGTAPGCLR